MPINTNSPDEGASQIVYRRDGLIRLSRNQQQVIENKFSYTNYDKYGRAIESGVSSEASIVANFNNLTDGDAIILNPIYCTEKSYTKYDFPDNTLLSISGIPSSYLNQSNLVGAVSSTSIEFKPNEYVTSYYSYTIDGQVEWVVRNYPVIGPKTIRYEYNELGLLASDYYQEGSTSEEIKHIYTYNPDGSLNKTETLRPDEEEPLLQSLYKYYCNGSLKRLEIGHGRFSTPLQGIDYIYNSNGLLKAINSPEMATSLHPMPDDPVGRDYNDVFGMSIDYYQNDYKKYNPFISTDPFSFNNYYDGKIATIRWKLQTELPYISINDHPYSWFNAYNYDSRNWLGGSDFKKVLFVNPYGAISYVVNSHEDYKLFGITYDANGNIKTLKRNGTSTVNLAMDDLIYRYQYVNPAQPSQGIVSNRLYHVNDAVTANSYPGALTDQGTFSSTNVASTNNYRYDAIGRLIRDGQSHRSFQYNAYGLLSQMLDDDQGVVATYNYDDNGKRFYKISRQRDVYRHTWYVNDVNGNLLAVYEATSSSPSTSGITPELSELPIYGAARLGQIRPQASSTLYELTDHQGSLRALVKRSKNQTVGLAAYKDYYPFGQLMPGRNYQSTDYRYGYQGQFAETDPETGFTHFDAREFDTRLGRWMIPDPAGQYFSPYLGMGNNPVSGIDPDGTWDSPIFNSIGRFLGLDSKGWSGEILIFNNEKDFIEGMDHDLALEKGIVFDKNTPIIKTAASNIIRKVLWDVVFPDQTKIYMSSFKVEVRDISDLVNAKFGNNIYTLNFGDYEFTVENIRANAVHEVWGHGIKKFGNVHNNHYKCYFAEMDSRYWDGTTPSFKIHSVNTNYNRYYYEETGSKVIPSKYSSEFFKYYKK